MTVKELYEYMNEKIPPSLSCEWDNDGLMCCPNPERRIRKVLVALDVSEEIVDKAVANECDVIVSHHPLVFKPIKSLTTYAGVPRKLIKLVENGIAVMSFHTRFDAVCGGVNDVLANVLGLKNVESFGVDGDEMGRVGFVEETELPLFAAKVKETLGSPVVLYSGNLPVKRVAVLGGNGDDFVSAAKNAGADTYLSGRIGYHMMADAKENGINLVEAGHYFTENPALNALAELVNGAIPTAEIIFADSNNVNAI